MSEPGLFQNIRVYCTCIDYILILPSVKVRLTYILSATGLAFVVYWGIVLFGYDT